MGLTINMGGEPDAPFVVVDVRLWLTADRERLVPEGHPECAFLFAGIGKRVSRDDAVRYGLIPDAEAEPDFVAGGIVPPPAPVVIGDEGDEVVVPFVDEPEPVAPPKPKRGRPPKAKA